MPRKRPEAASPTIPTTHIFPLAEDAPEASEHGWEPGEVALNASGRRVKIIAEREGSVPGIYAVHYLDANGAMGTELGRELSHIPPEQVVEGSEEAKSADYPQPDVFSGYRATGTLDEELSQRFGGREYPEESPEPEEPDVPGFARGFSSDAVNHPAHYRGFSNGAKVIDIVEHLGFNLGNAVKYVARVGGAQPKAADLEGQIVDLRKALRYIQREISLRQGLADAHKIADGSNAIVVGWGDER